MYTETQEKLWEDQFIEYFSSSHIGLDDASHDLGHFRRVYFTAKQIALTEKQPVDRQFQQEIYLQRMDPC